MYFPPTPSTLPLLLLLLVVCIGTRSLERGGRGGKGGKDPYTPVRFNSLMHSRVDTTSVSIIPHPKRWLAGQLFGGVAHYDIRDLERRDTGNQAWEGRRGTKNQ